VILREAFDYEFSRLDPTGDHIDPPSVAVYETLLAKGPDWGAHSMLAEGWETSSDGLEWRVRMRPGLRFHSGASCDAPAVLESLEHLRWMLPGRQLWYWDPVDTVEALDPLTLAFHLHHPYSRLPALLWGTHTAVYNERLRAEHPDDFGFTIADGTGPFRLVSWSPERIVTERWPDYAPAPAPFLEAGGRRVEQIEWISILNEDERLAALEDGRVDCLHGPPLGEVERLRADPRFEVIEQPQASNMYLALDWRRSDLGFDDPRIRRAISLAVDRRALVERGLAGHGSPALGPVPPGDEFYDPSIDAEGRVDPEQARAVLVDQRLRFECVVQDDPVFRRVAALVVGQLADVGVRVEPRFVRPFAPFYGAVAQGPSASISKWLWQDPLDALIGFSATHAQPFPNWQHASAPALDDAYRAWLRAGSHEELAAAATIVQRVFAEQLPYVPLLVPNDVWVRSRRVHGWRPFPANLYPFYHGLVVDDA
jgi:ABC-type transport system substrate-binding protein